MEKAYILKQDVIGERCIKSYFRCRDDIFMIAEGGNGNLGTPPRHWKFVANQNKSSYLSWVVSSDSIVFLDTELYLGLRWKAKSKIDSRTHMKTRHPWVFHCLSKVLIKIGYTCGGHGVKSEGLREDPHSTLNSSKPRISSSRALKSMSAMKTVVDNCTNLEFTTRLGVKSKSRSIRRGVSFEYHLVLSRANLQSVVDRWSVTGADAVEASATRLIQSQHCLT